MTVRRTYFERSTAVADGVCRLLGIAHPSERRTILRLAQRWAWRAQQREAEELGYVELGGESG